MVKICQSFKAALGFLPTELAWASCQLLRHTYCQRTCTQHFSLLAAGQSQTFLLRMLLLFWSPTKATTAGLSAQQPPMASTSKHGGGKVLHREDFKKVTGRDKKHLGRRKRSWELEHVGQSNKDQYLAATFLKILKVGQQAGKRETRNFNRKSQTIKVHSPFKSPCDSYCKERFLSHAAAVLLVTSPAEVTDWKVPTLLIHSKAWKLSEMFAQTILKLNSVLYHHGRAACSNC